MRLEYLLALHRKNLSELNIVQTFKYSSIVGLILSGIINKLLSGEIRTIELLMIIYFILIVYFLLSMKETSKKEKLKWIEENIKKLEKNK